MTPLVFPLARTDVRPDSMLALLRRQAHERPEACAYTFLWDDGTETSLSFRQLDAQARAIAAVLQQVVEPGDRVLLVYPPGLDFIAGFFGCLYAGVLAVPATYPKPRRPSPRLTAIAADCQARAALSTSQTLLALDLPRVAPDLESLRWIATDRLPREAAMRWECPRLDRDDLAFLQYTSGSTSDPKGVMISHGNLLANLEMIRQGFDIPGLCAGETSNTGVSWLPAYHDMGLVGGILESLYVGGRSVLMSPASFLQRPYRWLKAISDHRAVVSGAPCFAFDLCVRKITPQQRASLDLSSWRLAFCGAEPIRPETLAEFAEMFAPCGFQASSYYPCYGLAEATLLAAGGDGPTRPVIFQADRTELARHRIVQVEGRGSGLPLPPVAATGLGEGWGEGNGRTTGHIQPPSPPAPLPQAGEGSFSGRSLSQAGEGSFSGCSHPQVGEGSLKSQPLVACGGSILDEQLLVVDPQTCRPCPRGQVGEIWIQGPNVARGYWKRPDENRKLFQARLAGEDDCESYLRTGDLGFCNDGQLYVTGRLKDVIIIRGRNHYPQDIEHTAGRAHPALIHGAAAALTIEVEGRQRLVVIQEIQRQQGQSDLGVAIRAVRRDVARDHELDLQAVVLIRQATLPRTTSGKVQRSKCRQQYLAGDLKVVAHWTRGQSQNGSPNRRGDRPGENRALLVEPARRLLARLAMRNGAVPDRQRVADEIGGLLVAWLVDRTDARAEEIEPDRALAEMGLDSLAAVDLSQELEDALDLQLTPVLAWNYPTLATLSRHLAEQLIAGGEATTCRNKAASRANGTSHQAGGDLERLLSEIETLSEAEVQEALEQPRRGM